MQYYIKIFNNKTNELIGYYKETGKGCITRLPNGMKYFNDIISAYNITDMLQDGQLRDKDGHYYKPYFIICEDPNKQPPKEVYKTSQEKESEMKDELDAFIRKNRSKNA